MSLSLSLKPRVLRSYDVDAASYISAVETADNQTLEQGIKDAINEFVIDCKVRGIWGAIKSCCLLCGARTIAGATIPLKGDAPILTSFVGDYNRETGLRRASGAFNINRNNDTDPQNNKHVAVYPTSIDYGTADNNFRSILTGSTVSGSTFFTVNSIGLNVRVNTSTSIVGNQPVNAGLIGVSVLDSSRSQLLYNSRINIININTTTPATTDLSLFAGGGVSTSLSRVAFYSVGESLDLRLLDQCVSKFNDSLYRLFYPTSLHPEALTWINSAQSNNNPRISATLANALNTFCNSIDNASLRNKFYRLNLFCGPNLTAVRRPLYRGISPTDTQYGFALESSFNFNQSSITPFGLSGNGSNRYLETGFPVSVMASLFPSNHLACYCNNVVSAGTFISLSDGSGTGSWTLCAINVNTANQLMHSIGGFIFTAGLFDTVSSSNLGLRIISRTANNNQTLYIKGISVGSNSNNVSTISNWSFGGVGQTVRLFASRAQENPPGDYSNITSCGYSIGSSLSAQEALDYNNIIETFNIALSRKA